MGKREGEFVTLRQLREEVGNDACRFFYLMRSHDQHLDFDLELAKSRSNENPVYYIQYAHARVASIMRSSPRAACSSIARGRLRSFELLEGAHGAGRAAAGSPLPGSDRAAAPRARAARAGALPARARQHLPHLVQRRAFIVAEAQLRDARLALAHGVQQVIRNGLELLGVSAPDSM